MLFNKMSDALYLASERQQSKPITIGPGADSENLDFVAPLEEHRVYGIFCFFISPAFILKILPLSKYVRKTL